MPKILYIIKVILIFFAFKFAAEIIAEGIVIGIHFAFGKNPLKGEMFGNNTITLITYFGYSILGLNLSGNDEIVSSVFDMRSVGNNVLNGGIYGIEASVITTVVLGTGAAILLARQIKRDRVSEAGSTVLC